MTAFKFGVTSPLPYGAVESAALGVSALAGNLFTSKDVNKVVKLAGNNNFVLAANGDAIEGIVSSVEAGTVNSGWSYGGVQTRFYTAEAQNGAAQATLAVGDRVVAFTQAVLGTAQEYPQIRKAAALTAPVAPTDEALKWPQWRVKSLLAGTGLAGEVVLIEALSR